MGDFCKGTGQMGFGIWQALIIVAFLALPIIAIWTEKSDEDLSVVNVNFMYYSYESGPYA